LINPAAVKVCHSVLDAIHLMVRTR
jgi:hypothetical protein